MIHVLFLCVHNASRSQMAEAYLQKYGEGSFEAESAGLVPGTLNPYVIRAMAEDGIDISGKSTKDVYSLYQAGRKYRYVISVCDAESAERCPIFPGVAKKLHWPFPDPSKFEGSDDEIMAQVREVRDSIKEAIRAFVKEHEND